MTHKIDRSSVARREHRVRVGNYEARKRGARRFDFSDPYRIAVAFNWAGFLAGLVAVELLLNVLFALLYLARPGSVANLRPGSLSDAFFFSLETLSTVGYGEMYPADFYGHLVSSAEIIIGVVFVAITTGLIFVRVSRPKPCFRYADAIVITSHRGQPTLMIRVASEQLGVLYDAQAQLSALVPAQNIEGQASRTVVDLPLLRTTIPVLALSWTLMHVIDEASPLAGLDEQGMHAAGLRLFLTIRAEDATLSTTVRDLHAYAPAQIHFGMSYANALAIDADGHPVVDLDRIGLIQAEGGATEDDGWPVMGGASA